VCTNLIVVQRVLRRRHVRGRVRGRELPRERIDWIGGRRHRRREYMLIANAVAEVGRHGGRGHLRAAIVWCPERRRCPERRKRRRCLYHCFGVHRVYAWMMVLALSQLAANKANRNHSSVAPNHLPALLVQPRELACLRDRVPGTRQLVGILWALQGIHEFPKLRGTESLTKFRNRFRKIAIHPEFMRILYLKDSAKFRKWELLIRPNSEILRTPKLRKPTRFCGVRRRTFHSNCQGFRVENCRISFERLGEF